MKKEQSIEPETRHSSLGAVSGSDLRDFVVIKVGDKNRLVHQEVEMVMTEMGAHIEKLKREVKGYKLMLGKIQAGDKVGITGEESMMFAHEKMTMEWEVEVRSGMTGWIQANWGKLCSVKCDCGALVSYDILRKTNELKCDTCGGRHCH